MLLVAKEFDTVFDETTCPDFAVWRTWMLGHYTLTALGWTGERVIRREEFLTAALRAHREDNVAAILATQRTRGQCVRRSHLLLAAEHGLEETMHALVPFVPGGVPQKEVMEAAVKSGKVALVRRLLETGWLADGTASNAAAGRGDIGMLNILHDAGHDCRGVMSAAAIAGNTEVIQWVIDKGISSQCTIDTGLTPFHALQFLVARGVWAPRSHDVRLALYAHRIAVARWLLDLDAVRREMPPLVYMCEMGRTEDWTQEELDWLLTARVTLAWPDSYRYKSWYNRRDHQSVLAAFIFRHLPVPHSEAFEWLLENGDLTLATHLMDVNEPRWPAFPGMYKAAGAAAHAQGTTAVLEWLLARKYPIL